MFYDNINNSALYTAANPDFAKAFEFIRKAVSENLPVGKYEIDGDKIFASVQEYTSKSSEGAIFEGHRKYIDVQYVISGIEAIEVVDITKTKVLKEYDSDLDAAFFENSCRSGKLVLEAGDWAVFYPHDLHKPGLAFDVTPSEVKKIVVKVRV